MQGAWRMSDAEDKREYPCPKCTTGELYDAGGMFAAIIQCDNPDCDYEDLSGFCGCVAG